MSSTSGSTTPSDTAPGSSGAPVFNDEWQLVGITPRIVPRESLSGDESVINEGVRISAIVSHLVEEFGGG
jgi:endonuclease G